MLMAYGPPATVSPTTRASAPVKASPIASLFCSAEVVYVSAGLDAP